MIGKVTARYLAVTPGVTVRYLAVTRGMTVRYLTVTSLPPPRSQHNPGHPLGQVCTPPVRKNVLGLPRGYHAVTPDVTAI